jgi:hypothetical protein
MSGWGQICEVEVSGLVSSTSIHLNIPDGFQPLALGLAIDLFQRKICPLLRFLSDLLLYLRNSKIHRDYVGFICSF